MTEKGTYARKEGHITKKQLQGIFVPVVVPFKFLAGDLRLDTESYLRHIRNLAQSGLNLGGLFLGSNAGQGRTLPKQILEQTISWGIEAARYKNHHLPITVGALRDTAEEAIDIAKYASELGADAVVIAPGLTDEKNPLGFLTAVEKAIDLPIIIYNNPGFQNNGNLPMEFLTKAATRPRIYGIKDSSGDPEYFQQILEIFHRSGKKVLQGSTKAGLSRSILEADGMVPVEANVYPRILAGIFDPNNPVFKPDDLDKVLNLISGLKTELGNNARTNTA